MQTILTPCRVPWRISPSTSGVTLRHSESDVEPECSVVFGAGRQRDDDRTDSRRVEITFERCYYARVGPHSDSESVEALGYVIEMPDDRPRDVWDAHQQYLRRWRETGLCPGPGFYIAKQSEWLVTLPDHFQQDFRHYVVDGRDGYVELIARCYKWREWLWSDSDRELAPSTGPVVGQGEGMS